MTARGSTKLVLIAACVVGSALAPRAGAHAQSGFAGSYQPSPQRMEVKVSTWGEDCGTRPQSQTLNEPGKVIIKDDGSHLSLRFSTRTIRSNSCWSPNPGLALVSSTSGSGRYRAECRTPAGDPKREIGRYTIVASPGQLELTEESEYDWQLKASHCVAKVRITQTLSTDSAPVSPPPPAPVVDAGAPSPAPKCVPGAAARLRMRPLDARIAPGERVCFVVRAVDGAGCELADSSVELTLQRPPGVQGSVSGSCFRAAENAALAEGVFKVLAAQGALRAEASVVVSAPDLSDITARRTGSGASSLGSTGRATDGQSETGVRAVTKSGRDFLWIGIGIAALATVIALAAFIALRAARKPARPVRPRSSFPQARGSAPVREAAAATSSGPALPPAALPAARGPQRICPKCRRGYPPGSERCATDGEALIDYEQFAASAATKSSPRFCPECGKPLASGALFCGECGHKMTIR